jgi:hypothetical protein
MKWEFTYRSLRQEMKGFLGVTDNEAGMDQGAGLRAQGN